MTLLSKEQRLAYYKNVLTLQNYCDSDGIQSVIQGAAINVKNAILGNAGFMEKINGLLKDKKLPTMRFEPEEHTEDFMKRAGGFKHPLTESEIQGHYYKLGMLEAVMRTAGITDLHGCAIFGVFSTSAITPAPASFNRRFSRLRRLNSN